jgi:pimeloyl-ACP methyl ester carboxylesterase
MSAVAIRATLILLAVAHANAFLHFPAFSNVGRTLEHSAHHCPRMGLAPAKEGSVAVQQGNDLWYRLVRPMALSSQKGRPLVVLHGGPQVPSDYLFALSGVDYRSVLFYDQLGCGRSDAPAIDQASYSVEASVADLEDMLAGVGIRDYHLLGQSWGGILAYEFLRAGGPAAQTCRSVIISNSPTSVALVEEEAGRLVDAAGSVDAFKAAHECRLPVRPKALEDAYAHAGALWRGTSAIADWSLDPDAPTLKVCFTKVLLHAMRVAWNGTSQVCCLD